MNKNEIEMEWLPHQPLRKVSKIWDSLILVLPPQLMKKFKHYCNKKEMESLVDKGIEQILSQSWVWMEVRVDFMEET